MLQLGIWNLKLMNFEDLLTDQRYNFYFYALTLSRRYGFARSPNYYWL